jgi:hypothetical protein
MPIKDRVIQFRKAANGLLVKIVRFLAANWWA